VRHAEAQAKADANLEVAWLAAEAGERKAREAAGAAAFDDAARRAKLKQRAMVRRGLGVGLARVVWWLGDWLLVGWGEREEEAQSSGRCLMVSKPTHPIPNAPPCAPPPQVQMPNVGDDEMADMRMQGYGRDKKRRKVRVAGPGVALVYVRGARM